MRFGTKHVPNEILSSVAGQLPVKDIRNLRLTCKGFEAVASRYLIRSLWISPASADQQKMLAVAQHPVFCKTIVEIKYDASWSVREDPEKSAPFSQASYIRRFCGKWATRALGFSVSKAAATRGYKQYMQRKDEEDTLATVYTGPDLTRYRDHDSLPDQFSILLQQPKSHNQVAQYLPSDLATLIKTLPRMPKIRHFVVSDCRYSRTHGYCNLYSGFDNWDFCKDLNYAFDHRGIRGSDAFVLKPRPWISNNEEYVPMSYRQVYRGFPVMLQAASMMGMTSLESFSIERDSDDSGLSCQLFDMSPSELHHSLRAFNYLRNLTLKLNTLVGPNTLQQGVQFADVMRTGALAQVCMAAQGLETLNIQLDGPNMMEVEEGYAPPVTTVALEKLIGNSTWSKLTSLTLGWMEITKDEFLAFYDRQHHTLRRLNLEGVMLTSEIGTSENDGGPRRPLQDAFSAMAAGSIKLQYLKVDNNPEEESDRPVYFPLHFESEDQAAILRFLSSGGIDGNCLLPHGPGCRCMFGYDLSLSGPDTGPDTESSDNSQTSSSSSNHTHY